MKDRGKTIRLLGVPMDLGAGRRGVDMGARFGSVARALPHALPGPRSRQR
jgi:arginase family enzyme